MYDMFTSRDKPKKINFETTTDEHTQIYVEKPRSKTYETRNTKHIMIKPILGMDVLPGCCLKP